MPSRFESLLKRMQPVVQIEPADRVAAPPAVEEEDDEGPYAAIYARTAKELLDVQISTSDVLDSRVSTALGVGSTVLPLAFGLLTISGALLGKWVIGFLVVSLIAYIVLLFASLKSSVGEQLDRRPNTADLRNAYENANDPASFERWIADELLASVDYNDDVLDIKARWAGIAIWALHAEGIALSVASVLALPTIF